MDMLLAWVVKRPLICAALSGLSLLDALNCVRLGHEDWWLPAGVAALFAAGVRKKR